MRVTYNPQGKITKVEDNDGTQSYRPQKKGPTNDTIAAVNVTTIIQTNPFCWIPTAGGWYKVPC